MGGEIRTGSGTGSPPGGAAAPGSGTLFDDRAAAGRRLARRLGENGWRPTVVVGVARGGIVVGAEVARALRRPMIGVAVRKVHHPRFGAVVIGAVTPTGEAVMEEFHGCPAGELDGAVGAARREAAELERTLGCAPALPPWSACLLVDDGLGTGISMLAVIAWARAAEPVRLLVAAPVADPAAAARVRREVDGLRFVHEGPIVSVGACYRRFEQVDDRRARRLLAELAPPAVGGGR
jgi:putative phosphoribosyl transferase